ncbi:MAG: 50S ribosomal protein L21 [Anaerolineae bacterium]
MYAVIQSGSRQYRVEPGQTVAVDSLAVEAGDEIVFDQVLLASGDDGLKVGSPTVAGAKVVGRVIDHYRTRKVVVFKYKAKERYRRKGSQRRNLTRIHIDSIVL